jgi:hypothetical protein
VFFILPAWRDAVAQPLEGLAGEERPVTEDFRREHPAMGWTAGFLWESKYVTEGRDNLEEGGIFSWEAAGEVSGFAAGAWFGLGDSEDYRELNLFIEYAHEFGDIETYVGYTRLEFYPDHESDNELSAGLAYHGFPYLIPGVDYVYSTEAKGSFVEVSLRSELGFFEDRLMVSPYILEGFDFGYASEEYDGPNNLQIGARVTYHLAEWCEVFGFGAHSWAHGDVEREGLGDLSWGGAGVSVSF